MAKSPVTCLSDHFQLGELASVFAEKSPDTVSLRQLMGDRKDVEKWKEIAIDFGQFLAKFCKKTNLENLPDEQKQRIPDKIKNNDPALLTWLRKHAIDDQSLSSVISEHFLQVYGSEQLKARSNEAVEKLTNNRTHLIFQHFKAENMFLQNGLKIAHPVLADVTLAPPTLQAATFLADLFFVRYSAMRQQQCGTAGGCCSEGGEMNVVNACNAFGDNFEKKSKELLGDRFKRKPFWKEITLLTGWEIIRRCHEANCKPDSQGNDMKSGIEAGLRLANNVHIESIGRLTFVGFALC